MLFNTFSFGAFFFVVYLLYWTIFNRSQQRRNVFLLAVSYFFYGCWDWRFILLIAGVSSTDYFLSREIHKTENQKKRKIILIAVLGFNLGLLGFFKYYHFFVDSFINLMILLGLNVNQSTLQIVLPVGISFFTFQGLSYVLDIYYKKIEPTDDIIAFFTFISFFPQLVAGPIERARDLLPQFTDKQRRKPFDYIAMRKGLLLIAAGLFKKMVIADRVAIYVDNTYSDIAGAAGWPSIIAIAFFAIQLYLDFSAYSQIAIGTAKMLGFRLSKNFDSPYLSTSFKDFWARWHITLTSWFRDYLYFPLGGSKKGRLRTYTNVMIIFAVSGLWHGASWNFVIWGCLNGMALVLFDKILHLHPTSWAGKIISCFFVVTYWALSLVFFRSESFGDAVSMLGNIGFTHFDRIYNYGLNSMEFRFSLLTIAGLMIVEILLKNQKKTSIHLIFNHLTPLRWLCYLALVLGTIYFGIYGNGADNNFIYFQF